MVRPTRLVYGILGVALAVVAVAWLSTMPATVLAQQGDLDCPDFQYQEDAQAVLNADPSGPPHVI